ncbi:DNA replication complex GINS protein PSF2 [Anabarilius grahami]|uniref:DNA replication complex GINS protein PSF2 n=1 Tax=Anabarilius grahami TaxID=495550 RepID=A0A3N0XQG6_ANAGA|nr:DNA replication complex GINS protein PSF2 [Anabarilius grahami]
MDPAEVEFLAEKEMVKIIPNFSLDKIYLIGGDLGPFNPGLPVEVPLWLALNLKQRQKCRIVPPEWMDTDLYTFTWNLNTDCNRRLNATGSDWTRLSAISHKYQFTFIIGQRANPRTSLTRNVMAVIDKPEGQSFTR